jgi:hypothetical protein
VELVALLIALYLVECCVWLREGQVALYGHSKGEFAYRIGPHLPSGHHGGVFVGIPWPPAAITLVLASPPEAQFDVAAVEAKWAIFTAKTRLLRSACDLGCVYLLVIVPTAIMLRGIALTWPFLVAGWLAILPVIIFEFASAFSACYPDGDRPSKLAAVALSPLSAARACDLLSRELLASYHPLASAYVLCSTDVFCRLARFYYFSGDDSVAQSAVDAFIVAVGHREDVLRAPHRGDTTFLSYCPRCEAQYTRPDGYCADCRAVHVQPFI